MKVQDCQHGKCLAALSREAPPARRYWSRETSFSFTFVTSSVITLPDFSSSTLHLLHSHLDHFVHLHELSMSSLCPETKNGPRLLQRFEL